MVRKDQNPEIGPTPASPKTYEGLVRTIGELTNGRGSQIYTVDALLNDKPSIDLLDREASVLQGPAGRIFKANTPPDSGEDVRLIEYNAGGQALVNDTNLPRASYRTAEIRFLKTDNEASLTGEVVFYRRGVAVVEGTCRLPDTVSDIIGSAEVKEFAGRWGVEGYWNQYAASPLPLLGREGPFQEVVSEGMGRKMLETLKALPKLPR